MGVRGHCEDESDAKCVEWSRNLFVARIVVKLRDDFQESALPKLLKVLDSLCEAGAASSFDTPRFNDVLGSLRSLADLVRSATFKGDVLPSIVRKALGHLGGMPFKHPLKLALAYGSTGQAVMSSGDSFVQERQQDIAASARWVAVDSGFAGGEHPDMTCDGTQHLRDKVSVLSKRLR